MCRASVGFCKACQHTELFWGDFWDQGIKVYLYEIIKTQLKRKHKFGSDSLSSAHQKEVEKKITQKVVAVLPFSLPLMHLLRLYEY